MANGEVKRGPCRFGIERSGPGWKVWMEEEGKPRRWLVGGRVLRVRALAEVVASEMAEMRRDGYAEAWW